MPNCRALLLISLGLFPGLIIPYASGADDLPGEEYAIRETVPQTGTRIKQKIVWGSSIPINRTYSQLTDEQKQQVHALYEQIAPGDEPPFPMDGLRPILLAIWKGHAVRAITGKLTLVADVDATGTVTKVEVLEDPDPVLSRYAASVLLLTRFKPALCNAVPCQMQYPLRFVLETT